MTQPALPTRTLGDLAVPAIGFGAMVLSPGMYGEVDEDRARQALHAALDGGGPPSSTPATATDPTGTTSGWSAARCATAATR